MANGPIPDGMLVCHRCDVRHCVNPAHLFLGTAADNNADMVAKGRHVVPRSDYNPRVIARSMGVSWGSKLTAESVRAMRAMRAETGCTYAKIGEAFGVSKAHASRVVQGQRWDVVKP